MDSSAYVIVGGGLAGAYAAIAIRERDADGRIVVVSEDAHRPYDRVPLSKRYLMGLLSRDGVFLRKEEFYPERRIEFRPGVRATRLDPSTKTVTTPDGAELPYDRLLLATGGRVRTLLLPGANLAGICYLRTLEDSDAIKEAIGRAKKAVVVGGGFLGCEVAAACVAKGLDATVVEMGPYLLNLVLEEPTGRWLTDYLGRKGVRIVTNARATRFVGTDGRFSGLETASGDVIDGDFVVAAAGIVPNDAMAREAGLRVDDGILVNERLETSEPGIYAAGDVARFRCPPLGRTLRVEHYDVAVRQGRLAGANMTGAGLVIDEVPYFFSDLFDLKIHVHGDLSDCDRVVLRGERTLTPEAGLIEFYLKSGRLLGYLSVNRKLKEERACQKMVREGRRFEDPAVLEEPRTDLVALAG